MGADGWTDVGPWYEEPADSLRSLQQKRLPERFPLDRFVTDRLADVRQALDSVRQSERNAEIREHLSEVFGADVAYLESVQSRQLPTDLDGQLAIVRRVCGADGCGGVLDVRGIGSADDFAAARVLSADELTAAFGTTRPTLADVRRGGHRLPDVGRAESFCFPVFDEGGTGTAWHFVGRTFD